jgi:hypothetical protein
MVNRFFASSNAASIYHFRQWQTWIPIRGNPLGALESSLAYALCPGVICHGCVPSARVTDIHNPNLTVRQRVRLGLGFRARFSRHVTRVRGKCGGKRAKAGDGPEGVTKSSLGSMGTRLGGVSTRLSTEGLSSSCAPHHRDRREERRMVGRGLRLPPLHTNSVCTVCVH